MSNDATQWITVREAAELSGRKEGTIRGWYKSGRVSGKRDGRALLLRRDQVEANLATIEAKAQGRKPKRGRPKLPRVAEEETLTVAEFAARAGVNQRTVQLWRQRGEIERYTEDELANVIVRRDGSDAAELDPATATDDELRTASQNELKRVKLYHEARMARVKADREEGRVYEADQVDAILRRLVHLAQSGWQQVPMILPQQLAGKDSNELRALLARHAQDQIEALANAGRVD